MKSKFRFTTIITIFKGSYPQTELHQLKNKMSNLAPMAVKILSFFSGDYNGQRE
jgi:hypothetical protein